MVWLPELASTIKSFRCLVPAIRLHPSRTIHGVVHSGAGGESRKNVAAIHASEPAGVRQSADAIVNVVRSRGGEAGSRLTTGR